MTDAIPIATERLPDRAAITTAKPRGKIRCLPDAYERPVGPFLEAEAWRYDPNVPACAVHHRQCFEHYEFLNVEMNHVAKSRRDLCSRPACFGRFHFVPASRVTRVTERVRSLLGCEFGTSLRGRSPVVRTDDEISGRYTPARIE